MTKIYPLYDQESLTKLSTPHKAKNLVPNYGAYYLINHIASRLTRLYTYSLLYIRNTFNKITPLQEMAISGGDTLVNRKVFMCRMTIMGN